MNLQKILNNELSNHIREIIPSFRNMIQDHLDKTQNELAQYGEDEYEKEYFCCDAFIKV